MTTEGGELFVAYAEDIGVGTVATRFHRDGSAELKRLYVRAVARRRGLADRLVRRVVDEACDWGCRSVWLESLPGVMDPAIALYRRHHFVELGDGPRTIDVDGVVVMERALTRDRRSA